MVIVTQVKLRSTKRNLPTKERCARITSFIKHQQVFYFYRTTTSFEKHREQKKGNPNVATIKETKREHDIPAFCKLPRISMVWRRFKAAWKQECWSNPEQVPCLLHSCDQKLSPSLLGQFKDPQYCCSCGFKSDIYIKNNVMWYLSLFNNEILRIIHNAYTWTKNVLLRYFPYSSYERDGFFFALPYNILVEYQTQKDLISIAKYMHA